MSLLYFVTLYHCKVWSAVGQRSLKIACNWATSENSYPRSLLKIITVYSICVINKKCSGFNPSNLHRVPVSSLRNEAISYDRWKIECSLILKGQRGLSIQSMQCPLGDEAAVQNWRLWPHHQAWLHPAILHWSQAPGLAWHLQPRPEDGGHCGRDTDWGPADTSGQCTMGKLWGPGGCTLDDPK